MTTNCNECPCFVGTEVKTSIHDATACIVSCTYGSQPRALKESTSFDPKTQRAKGCPLPTQCRPTRFYVASSWRNERQRAVVTALNAAGHSVYDFRNPAEDNPGFGFHRIDPNWQKWPAEKFREMLGNPLAVKGFEHDLAGMQSADAFVLVLPCGRSAHLEAGWAIGQGLPVAILLDDASEPELMYKLADRLVVNMDEFLEWARQI